MRMPLKDGFFWDKKLVKSNFKNERIAMEREKKTNIFNGKIGYNIPSSNEEKEEDLLEILYIYWKNGKAITIADLCVRLNMTRRELNLLIRQMVHHGYLEETEKNADLRLTEFGKTQGLECFDRHQYLTQFLQMVCGLDKDQAQDNACRMEHVVSGEVIQGICDFLKYGDTYDRVVQDFKLHSMYEAGSYVFCMGIYCTEKRYPRILADEFYEFSDEIYLEVGEDACFFYLRPKLEKQRQYLWYKESSGWKQACLTEKGFMIPADIFTFTVSSAVPITEGDGMIAFTDGECEPTEEDCRELNVHIW